MSADFTWAKEAVRNIINDLGDQDRGSLPSTFSFLSAVRAPVFSSIIRQQKRVVEEARDIKREKGLKLNGE